MGVETVHKVNEELLARLRELQTSRTVKVGVMNSKAEQPQGGRINMAMLAQVHEFGTTRAGPRHNTVIPERSFIRSTARLQKQNIMRDQQRLLDAYMRGKINIHQALGALGQSIVARIRRTIMAGIEPPNAPSTIARKGSSKPLIDTGHLYRSINYEVER